MTRATACLLLSMVALTGDGKAASLRPETLEAWARYVAATELRIETELSSRNGFLVQDFLPAADASRARMAHGDGLVFTAKLVTESPSGRAVKIPKGLAHHWVGSVLIPGAELDDVLEWLISYDDHQRYFDEVTDSALVSRDGDTFEISLRLRRKKIITVHYNTDHVVHYRRHGRDRVSTVSRATRIAEIDAPGTESEREKPVGKDRGFLWRLNSYWRIQQTDRGVIVEIETLSLSRGVPRAVKWLVSPYLSSVPRESLEATLLPIRAANTKRQVLNSAGRD